MGPQSILTIDGLARNIAVLSYWNTSAETSQRTMSYNKKIRPIMIHMNISSMTCAITNR
jgi:hypothetical protein